MRKVIALDIGGTNTRVALINEKFELETVLIKDTVTGNKEAFLASVSSIVEEAVPDVDQAHTLAEMIDDIVHQILPAAQGHFLYVR